MFFSMHKQLSNDACFTTVTKPRAHQHQAILLSAGHPCSQQWESKRSPPSSAQKLDPTGWGWSEQGNSHRSPWNRGMCRGPLTAKQEGVHRKRCSKKIDLQTNVSRPHLVTPWRDGNHCPKDHLCECGLHREGCKKWLCALGSSVLVVQVIHFVRVRLAEGSFLSFVIIRLLWDISSWTPRPSAFDNSVWLGGCLNESDFVSAFHCLLELRTKKW